MNSMILNAKVNIPMTPNIIHPIKKALVVGAIEFILRRPTMSSNVSSE